MKDTTTAEKAPKAEQSGIFTPVAEEGSPKKKNKEKNKERKSKKQRNKQRRKRRRRRRRKKKE